MACADDTRSRDFEGRGRINNTSHSSGAGEFWTHRKDNAGRQLTTRRQSASTTPSPCPHSATLLTPRSRRGHAAAASRAPTPACKSLTDSDLKLAGSMGWRQPCVAASVVAAAVAVAVGRQYHTKARSAGECRRREAAMAGNKKRNHVEGWEMGTY